MVTFKILFQCLFSIIGEDERSSLVLLIQYGSELGNLQILVADVLDGGNDPQFGYRCDSVGRSRERNLKTGSDTNHGLGASTDGYKTDSNGREGMVMRRNLRTA